MNQGAQMWEELNNEKEEVVKILKEGLPRCDYMSN